MQARVLVDFLRRQQRRILPSESAMDDWKLVPKGRPPEIEKAGESTLDASLPAKDRLKSRLASGLADRLVLKGTGPLPLIEDDPLVELLGKATNEELAPLVEILCTKGGVMCQLARTASYRNNQPNHQAYVRDIAAEIQKFGANTLKTQLVRGGKGVPYDQIVRDVAGRVGVKSGRFAVSGYACSGAVATTEGRSFPSKGAVRRGGVDARSGRNAVPHPVSNPRMRMNTTASAVSSARQCS